MTILLLKILNKQLASATSLPDAEHSSEWAVGADVTADERERLMRKAGKQGSFEQAPRGTTKSRSAWVSDQLKERLAAEDDAAKISGGGGEDKEEEEGEVSCLPVFVVTKYYKIQMSATKVRHNFR